MNKDQRLTDLKIDGAEPLVCGELQDWPLSYVTVILHFLHFEL